MAGGTIKTCWWDHVTLIEHTNAVLHRLNFLFWVCEHWCCDGDSRCSPMISIRSVYNMVLFEADRGPKMMKSLTKNLRFKKSCGWSQPIIDEMNAWRFHQLYLIVFVLLVWLECVAIVWGRLALINLTAAILPYNLALYRCLKVIIEVGWASERGDAKMFMSILKNCDVPWL